MVRIVGIDSLPQEKRGQLITSVSTPPIYISIEAYRYDERLQTTIYDIEIGIQQGHSVVISQVHHRFSALLEFDRTIRPFFNMYPHLLPFPPKKLFGKNSPSFIKERVYKLEQYLDHLGKVPGLPSSPSFVKTFGVYLDVCQ